MAPATIAAASTAERAGSGRRASHVSISASEIAIRGAVLPGPAAPATLSRTTLGYHSVMGALPRGVTRMRFGSSAPGVAPAEGGGSCRQVTHAVTLLHATARLATRTERPRMPRLVSDIEVIEFGVTPKPAATARASTHPLASESSRGSPRESGSRLAARR